MTFRQESKQHQVNSQMIVSYIASSTHWRTHRHFKSQDLDALQQWEKDWLMSFNPDKCEVIRITKKSKPIDANYTIHGKELGYTKNAKYLGVLISDTLSGNAHVDTVTKKANNNIAFLHRNLSNCHQHIKDTCYKTFVRPSWNMQQLFGTRTRTLT